MVSACVIDAIKRSSQCHNIFGIPKHFPRKNKFIKLTLPKPHRQVPDRISRQIRVPGTSSRRFSRNSFSAQISVGTCLYESQDKSNEGCRDAGKIPEMPYELIA